MELCARSIKSQEGSRLWLRRTRTLCKFNCGKERCAGALRLCGKARQSTPGARAEGAAQECSWEKVCGRWRKTFVMWQGAAAGSTAKRTKDSSSSKWFHAAAVTAGGERSWISVAVNLSTTTSDHRIGDSAKDHSSHGCIRRPAPLVVFVSRRAIESKAAGAWRATAVGQKTEVADAHETFGKQVPQESAQEFIER